MIIFPFFLNGEAYDLINSEDFISSKKLLEIALAMPSYGSFPVATLGYWYLKI